MTGDVAAARMAGEEGGLTGSNGASAVVTFVVFAAVESGGSGARGVCGCNVFDGVEVLVVDGVGVLLVALPSLITTSEGRSTTENSEDSLNFNDLCSFAHQQAALGQDKRPREGLGNGHTSPNHSPPETFSRPRLQHHHACPILTLHRN